MCSAAVLVDSTRIFFAGSLRYNVDPEGKSSTEIPDALASHMPLEFPIEEAGRNPVLAKDNASMAGALCLGERSTSRSDCKC